MDFHLLATDVNQCRVKKYNCLHSKIGDHLFSNPFGSCVDKLCPAWARNQKVEVSNMQKEIKKFEVSNMQKEAWHLRSPQLTILKDFSRIPDKTQQPDYSPVSLSRDSLALLNRKTSKM